MATFVSMLRGINVSGHKMIKMAELKALYESLGLRDVSTYIQSGNAVFRTDRNDSGAIGASIEQAIERRFGFPVVVIIRRPKELSKIIKSSPFSGRDKIDETMLYLTFLKAKPSAALVKALKPVAAKSRDLCKIVGSEIYLYCPDGYGKTLLSNAFFEKHLRVEATTRNWKTVNALSGLAQVQQPIGNST